MENSANWADAAVAVFFFICVASVAIGKWPWQK